MEQFIFAFSDIMDSRILANTMRRAWLAFNQVAQEMFRGALDIGLPGFSSIEELLGRLVYNI